MNSRTYMYNFEVDADSISVFGCFWSPRVISAYYTPFSKSLRFLTLINAYLCLRRKKAWDGKKWAIYCLVNIYLHIVYYRSHKVVHGYLGNHTSGRNNV